MKAKAFLFLSLFFSEAEVALIKERLAASHNQSESLFLSAILYVDETHWTLWLNGKSFHHDTIHELENYELKKVTSEGAEFLDPFKKTMFMLKNQQIYFSKEEKIFDFREKGVYF